mgnify:CR=1 FL=1
MFQIGRRALIAAPAARLRIPFFTKNQFRRSSERKCTIYCTVARHPTSEKFTVTNRKRPLTTSSETLEVFLGEFAAQHGHRDALTHMMQPREHRTLHVNHVKLSQLRDGGGD